MQVVSCFLATALIFIHAAFAASFTVDQKLINWLDSNRLPKSGIPLSYQVPENFWKEVHPNPFDGTSIYERVFATYGLNLYDGACWTIAMALNGQYESKVDPFIQKLLTFKFGEMSLLADDYSTFHYGDNGFKGKFPYFYRMTTDTYANVDPLTKTTLNWADWKPVTGENAWINLVGPLQSVLIWRKITGLPLRYEMKEIQLAVQSLDVFKAMQSKIGAVYYAPGTPGGQSGTEISAENNVSLYPGLNILRHILMDLGDPEGKLPLINDLILGITKFMRQHAYDRENGVFFQGGFINETGSFVPNPVFPVDVQTWGMSVFGAQVDEWERLGTAYEIWQKTRERSGVFDSAGFLQGVGYTDGHDVVSGEWTLGAINMCRILAKQYESTKPELAANLLKDASTMRSFLETIRDEVATDRSAYKYANKRFYIPFGWFANPIPSTASTAWTVMVDASFNPFFYTGEYLQPAVLSEI